MKISTKIVSTAKSRGGSALFIFALALLVFLLGPLPTGAHEAEGHVEGYNVEEHPYTTTAGDVDPTDRESVYNFLLHVRAHFKDPPSLNILTALKELSSTEGGDWRNDTTYLIRVNDFIRVNDRAKVIYHAYYPVTQDGSLDGSSVVRNLVKVANEKEDGDCVQYTLDGADRWACAAKFRSVGYNPATNAVWIVGFHHDFEDVSFAKNTCPYYVPGTSAIDVKDTKTLKQFVDEFAEHYEMQRRIVGEGITIVQRHCWRTLPWKYGSIYLFMVSHPSNRVIFNANSPTIEGRTYHAEDENGCNPAEEIDRVLAGEERQCKSLGYLSEDDKKEAFFEYLWDNPDVEGDEIDIDTECPNGPRTCALGRSHKVGYVTTIESLQRENETRIIGSGFYPETQEDRDDGDGCAIAGAGHKAWGAWVNLFLIISVLFSAVMLGNRYRRRRTASRKEGAGRRIITSLFAGVLALLVLVSWSDSAVAHEGNSYTTVAGDVDEADEGDMKNFVLHAKAHWDAIETPSENIDFERSLAEEGSDWNSGTVYLMAITEKGSILVHGEDPEVQNGTLIHYRTNEFGERESFLHEEVQGLIDAANGAEEGGCVRYGHEEGAHDMRVACAVKFRHPIWNADGGNGLILVGGYHHDHEEHEDTEISFAGIQCPYYAEVRNESPFFFQGVSANEVVDNESLKAFVEQFAAHFREQINLAGRSYAELAVIRNCWRILPWKYEPSGTYIFILTEDKLAFFNGLHPARENVISNPVDENGCVIGNEAVNVAIEGPGARQCKDLGLLPDDSTGFIEYLWNDPLNPDDDIDVFTECPNGPRTCSPGTTPKVSYLVPVDFLGQKFIIGSGYHSRGSGDDGDGCAVAGSGSGVKGSVFGLLLVVSVLFSVVFWRNRSAR